MNAIIFGLILMSNIAHAGHYPQLELTSKLLSALEKDQWEIAGVKLDLSLDFSFSNIDDAIHEICENNDSVKSEDSANGIGRLSCRLQQETSFSTLDCVDLKSIDQLEELQMTALSYLTAYSQLGLIDGVNLEDLELEVSTYFDLTHNYKFCTVDHNFYKSRDVSGGDRLTSFYFYSTDEIKAGESRPNWAKASVFIPGVN